VADCVICGRPTDGYACESCARPVRRDLIAAAALTADTVTTIARLDRMPQRGGRAQVSVTNLAEPQTSTGKPRQPNWLIEDRSVTPASALRPTAAPVNLDASFRVAAATNVIAAWARMVIEERGLPATAAPARPPLVGPTCEPLQDCRRHRTCRTILGQRHHARRGLGVAGRAALLLTNHLTWLRHHPAAGEALPALAQACAEIRRVIDRPPDLALAGTCDCGVRLYGRPGNAWITCTACGALNDARLRWDQAWRRANDRLVTAAEAVTLLMHEGAVVTRAQPRKRINQWAHRGQLVQRGTDSSGAPVYRYGDIADRMTSSAA